MPTLLNLSRCLAVAVVGLLIASCSQSSLPPPADDAFQSYLQVATNLARELAHSQPLRPGENIDDRLAASCNDLLKLQAAVEKLPADEIERLTHDYVDQRNAATAAWQELQREHAKAPQKFAPHWDKYAEALRFCSELAKTRPRK